MSAAYVGLWRSLGVDLERANAQAGGFIGARRLGVLRRVSLFFTPPIICCVLYRISHALHRRGRRSLAKSVARFNYLLGKVAIAPGSEIGPGLYLPHTVGVVFQGHAGPRTDVLAPRCPAADAHQSEQREIPSRAADQRRAARYEDDEPRAEIGDHRDVRAGEEQVPVPEEAAEQPRSARREVERQALEHHALPRRMRPQQPWQILRPRGEVREEPLAVATQTRARLAKRDHDPAAPLRTRS